VYGAKSRFMTTAVMACMEQVTYGEMHESTVAVKANTKVDVAARLRGMWN
jgi:hypothetical protein